MYFDIFNGDADGICALIQLRLHNPLPSQLITGVKRDIQLLDNVTVNAGDQLTVLDISLQKNRHSVDKFLSQGAHIFYVDHHQAGEIAQHPHLFTLIDTDPNICTSLLVNRYLHGKYPLWAIVAAFGDNLRHSAEQLATSLTINPAELQQLENLGIYVNYNSYAAKLADLHFAPAQLYQEMASFQSPLEFITGNRFIFNQLETGYYEDIGKAQTVKSFFASPAVNVFMLPDSPWARRVNGVFGNQLANLHPNKANAILVPREGGDYQVSLRAPLANKVGADVLCSRFVSGGGRQAAAGINHLPSDQVDAFIQQFEVFYATLK